MEVYKGFLIEEYSAPIEVRTFDGKNHVPTGQFTSEWRCRIINPQDGKVMGAQSAILARQLIDRCFGDGGPERLAQLQREIVKQQAKVNGLEEEINGQIISLQDNLEDERQKLGALKSSLPPEFR